MKTIISTLAVFAMVSAFCVGCDKSGDAAAGDGGKVDQQPAANPAANWEPETAKPKDDHAGHDHGPGGHGHDHGTTKNSDTDTETKAPAKDDHAGHDHGETKNSDTDAETKAPAKDDHAGHDHGPGEHDHEH